MRIYENPWKKIESLMQSSIKRCKEINTFALFLARINNIHWSMVRNLFVVGIIMCTGKCLIQTLSFKNDLCVSCSCGMEYEPDNSALYDVTQSKHFENKQTKCILSILCTGIQQNAHTLFCFKPPVTLKRIIHHNTSGDKPEKHKL